jgi:hypothetical protein
MRPPDGYDLCNEAWKIVLEYDTALKTIPSLQNPGRIQPCKKGFRHWFSDQPRRVSHTAE